MEKYDAQEIQDRPLETRFYKLEKLVRWEHVDEVNEMLMAGISPHKVSAWCKDMGFSISHPKLYDYKELLQEAVSKKVTVARLLGIGAPRRVPIILQHLGFGDTENLVKNEMEVLDLIVQRGFDVLATKPDVKIEHALRAIELKNKLTNGGHGGFTGYGLDQLRELETAKFQALTDVVLQYIPEDKIPELQEAMDKAERTFYEEKAPHLLEEYEKSIAEEQEDIKKSVDDIIVSDTKF